MVSVASVRMHIRILLVWLPRSISDVEKRITIVEVVKDEVNGLISFKAVRSCSG